MPSVDDAAAATSHDPMMVWAAEQPGARVWVRPGAVVLACAGLSRRDRLLLHGDPEAVAALLREVLPEAGRSFRPLGAEDLLVEVAARVPGLEVAGRFLWMDTTEPPGPAAPGPHWLDEDEWGEVAALLDEAFPNSYARPGEPGVGRWAGIRDSRGELLAVAADAWSTPRVGFLAGVATRTGARGRGLAATLCAFVTDELLAGRTHVGLFADHGNEAAIATYRRLGFTARRVAAAHQHWPSAST